METTLCYIFDGSYILMLHRIKKQSDYNQGKWIGIGGKVENESIESCLLREVKEETGLSLNQYTYFGKVHFHQSDYHEIMHLFRSDAYSGELTESAEGCLKFVHKDELFDLNLWPGDIIFLKRLLSQEPFNELHLYYEQDRLLYYKFK